MVNLTYLEEAHFPLGRTPIKSDIEENFIRPFSYCKFDQDFCKKFDRVLGFGALGKRGLHCCIYVLPIH